MSRCQFIEGDDFVARIRKGEDIFCGAAVLVHRVKGDLRESSFCPEHHHRCWTPPPEPKRRAAE